METRRRALWVLAAAVVVGVAHQLLTGGTRADGQPRELGDLIAVVAILAVGALVVFVIIVPWAARSPERTGPIALVASLAGLLGLPVLLWSASAMLLGGTGAVLGSAGEDTGPRGVSRAATVLGWLAFAINAALLLWFVFSDFDPGIPG